MMKLSLMRTSTGKEDPEFPLLQRIRSVQLPASEIAAQINAERSSSNRHISTSAVQRRLHESGLHGQIVQSHHLNTIEMVWDELDSRLKEKQSTSAQHMWELLQDCWKSIPGEAG
jgi:hypothetical protein